MTKPEQLIEYTTQDIIAFLMEDQAIELEEALRLFYTSDTYTKLFDPETGLYLEGSAYVYDIFQDELKYGYIVQAEY